MSSKADARRRKKLARQRKRRKVKVARLKAEGLMPGDAPDPEFGETSDGYELKKWLNKIRT